MSNFKKISELTNTTELLQALDILDLDESLIDEKIEKIMKKTPLQNNQLKTLLVFLKYKYMISLQEETDCENEIYVNFAIKELLIGTQEENDILLEILNIALLLNSEKILIFAEHLLQQLLTTKDDYAASSEDSPLIPLKIIDNILELCIRSNIKIHSMYVNNELEKILLQQEKIITTQFFSKTIPLIIASCHDYSVLNMIWDRIVSRMSVLNKSDFIILSTLSEYYLPLKTDQTFGKIESSILETYEFWNLLRCGFLSDNDAIRKCTIYLARRAIHCSENKTISVVAPKDPVPIFYWCNNEEVLLQNAWFTLFTLVESLEEKQSHLVLAALKLFDELSMLHNSWLNCIFVRAFSHESNSVIQQAVKMALKHGNNNDFPYKQLLHALNNTFLYENVLDNNKNPLISLLKEFCDRENNKTNLILTLPSVNLSPVPKFYILYALVISSRVDANDFPVKLIADGFIGSISSLLNNALIQSVSECCFLHFYLNNLEDPLDITRLLEIISYVSVNNLPDIDNEYWNNFICECHISPSAFEAMIANVKEKNVLNIKHLVNLLINLYNANNYDVQAKCIIESATIMLKSLADHKNREYSSSNEFNAYFFFIIYMIKMLEDIDDDDKLKTLFRSEIHDNTNVPFEYILTRLRTVSDVNEFDLIVHYIFGLHILINTTVFTIMDAQIESLYNMAESILKSTDIKMIQKCFAMKVMSEIVKHYAKCHHVKEIQNVTKIAHAYDIIKNTDYLERDMDVSKGKVIAELNRAKLLIYTDYYSCLEEWRVENTNILYEEIMHYLETGGHGCLLPLIHLTKLLLPNMLIVGKIHEAIRIVDRIWVEMFGLRKNDQFRICYKAFLKMLYQRNEVFSMIELMLLDYGDKLFELGDQIPYIVNELIMHIWYNFNGVEHFYLTPLLCKAILFGIVLRKDQRIEYECYDFISKHHEHFCSPIDFEYFENPVSQIRSFAINILGSQNIDLHAQVSLNLKDKLDISSKPNNRYHGNSLQHRSLLRTIQFFLSSLAKYKTGKHVDENVEWCIHRLTQQPHHISTRIFLEWYIALYIINMKLPLNQDTMDKLKLKAIPQISYFTIIYHILKHQINVYQTKEFSNSLYRDELNKNFDFAMQIFLPYTMGQLFNVRLHAQYYTLKLNSLLKNATISKEYNMVCDIIVKTFEISSAEKHLISIQNDYYINNFDIVEGLNFNNIYHKICRITGVAQDELGTSSFNEKDSLNGSNSIQEFTDVCADSGILAEPNFSNTNIQKKFIPWKNMLSELGISTDYNMENNDSSNLIVVAALIDRLPNLGGLSRTCEVFGVKEYVIDSLRHLQDKQFQSLSVSSEQWINIVEVTPGANLKGYLVEMKAKGYKIIGAEQTSSSVSLNNFSFPKNALLLLGHEKEGIPCNLLNLMDYCVEIPQHGLVRSLNVHVTASIFIWEYNRQHRM